MSFWLSLVREENEGNVQGTRVPPRFEVLRRGFGGKPACPHSLSQAMLLLCRPCLHRQKSHSTMRTACPWPEPHLTSPPWRRFVALKGTGQRMVSSATSTVIRTQNNYYRSILLNEGQNTSLRRHPGATNSSPPSFSSLLSLIPSQYTPHS